MLNILSALWKTEEEEKTAFLFLLVELENEEEHVREKKSISLVRVYEGNVYLQEVRFIASFPR